MPVAPLGMADWQLQLDDPLHHCWMVNTHLLLMVVVVVPTLLLRQLERHAPRRFRLQQQELEGTADGAAAAASAVVTAAAEARPAKEPAKGPAKGATAAEPGAAAEAEAAGAPFQLGGSVEAAGQGGDERLCPTQSWVVHWNAWEAAGAVRPPWAWLLDAYLLSCAVWAGLSLLASRCIG